MESLSTQIRNLIRAEMEIRGLSIRDLAKLLGCSKENVDQILRIGEREGKGMKTVIADRIFEVLELEVEVSTYSPSRERRYRNVWKSIDDVPGEMLNDGDLDRPTT